MDDIDDCDCTSDELEDLREQRKSAQRELVRCYENLDRAEARVYDVEQAIMREVAECRAAFAEYAVEHAADIAATVGNRSVH